jgi:hypothetical protein
MRTCGKERACNEHQDDGEDSAAGTLESAESHIAASTGTSTSCDGSGEAFSSTFSSLIDWAQDRVLIRVEADYEFFARPPDSRGNEHEVWFDAASKRWFKATFRNRFGLPWGQGISATPHEYLLRLLLQNRYFGDKMYLVAIINCEGKIRLLTSQPHVSGDFARPDEIQKWFRAHGFVRLEISERIAWYLKSENLLIADAHEGNVIKTPAGTIVPIDLNLIQPRGVLLEWVQLQTTGYTQMTLRL